MRRTIPESRSLLDIVPSQVEVSRHWLSLPGLVCRRVTR